jgi:integrase
LKGGWWVIPREHAKNGREHRVPLVGRALSILEELSAGRGDSDLVFPGRVNGRPIVNLAKPLARIIRRAGVVSFAIHDLRRTAATGLARNGVPSAIISKILNHVSGDSGVGRITQIYNRYEYDKEKLDALMMWDAHIVQIMRDHQEVAIASEGSDQ